MSYFFIFTLQSRLSKANIINAGKNGKQNISDEKAFKEGLFKLQVNFKEASKLIREHGGIVTVHAGSKTLPELSPGERGSLLLVFYLLLDAWDIPLVLDQPEDNLDNESVAKILVPFIRDAKKRRQIIIITHNANLAVVSDAEQVIRVKIDKKTIIFFLLRVVL